MKTTDLIIFSGQSNMQGQTERFPEDISSIDGAYEYRFLTDEIVNLKHPVGENINHFGKTLDAKAYTEIGELLKDAALLAPVDDNANMVPEFCKSYVKTTNRNVVAAHVAKGSTVIDYWLKDGQGYKMLAKKVKGAIKKVNPEHIYFVWLQGESDAVRGLLKKEYKKKMLDLNDLLKKELGVEKFGVILVGRFTMNEQDDEIIEAQKEVCNEHDDFYMLTTITEELVYKEEYMNPFVRGLYNSAGQELIGKIAGEALGRLCDNEL